MLFGKKKENTETDMSFNMAPIGENIAAFRKASGMTQAELAEKLGISFQAVSNWERGQSCPDVPKLIELSGLFGVSVDAILGLEDIPVKEDNGKEGVDVDVKVDVDVSVDENTQPDAEAYLPFLDYMDEDAVDGAAMTVLEKTGDAGSVAPFLDYMSSEGVGELALWLVNKTRRAESVEFFLDYMDEDDVGEVAKLLLKLTGDPKSVEPLLDYMDSDDIGELTLRFLKNKSRSQAEETDEEPGETFEGLSMDEIEKLLPYASTETVNGLFRQRYAEQGNFDGLVKLAPFADTAVTDELIVADYEAHKAFERFIALLPFAEEKTLEKLAKRDYEENRDIERIVNSLAPFLDESFVDKMVRNSLKKKKD